MLKWFALLCLLLLLALPTVALAQEPSAPLPTTEPFTATTQLDEALLWLIYAFSSVWLWSVAVEGGIEVVKARVLAYLPDTLKEAQKVVIVVGVLLLAYVTMKQGGYSVFDNAPFAVNQTLADVLTAVLLAVTAFGRHDNKEAAKTIAALQNIVEQLVNKIV